MVVFSNAESVEKNKVAVINNLCSKLATVIPDCPSPFVTSFSTYKKGVIESKPALIKHSGIDVFQQALENKINSAEYQQVRNKHSQSVKKMLVKEVENEINCRKRDIEDKASKKSNSLSKVQKDLTLFNSVFVERIENYNQI